MTEGSTEGPTLAEAQAQRDAAVRELQNFKTNTTRLIIREADNHGYGHSIDGWLRELGLTRPVRRFRLEWRKTLTEFTEVEAQTRAHAERMAYGSEAPRPEGSGWSIARVSEA